MTQEERVVSLQIIPYKTLQKHLNVGNGFQEPQTERK